jgi:hypothetical protein
LLTSRISVLTFLPIPLPVPTVLLLSMWIVKRQHTPLTGYRLNHQTLNPGKGKVFVNRPVGALSNLSRSYRR